MRGAEGRTAGATTACLLVLLLLTPGADATVQRLTVHPLQAERSQPVTIEAEGTLVGQVTLRILHGDAEHVLRQSVPPGAGSATFTWTVPATAATGTWRVTAHDTPQESLDHARSNLQVAPQPPRVVHAERTTPAAVPWTTGTIGVDRKASCRERV